MTWESPVIPWELCDDKRRRALTVAWNAGNLSYKFHPEQKKVADQIVESWGFTQSSMDRIFTGDISRQFGKDYLMSALGIGACYKRRKPTRICYAAPTREMLKELIVPTIVDLFRDCPPDLLPEEVRKGTFERTADTLTWPWGARIVLCGVDLHPDRLRGPATYGFLFTECAFVSNLVDLVDGVILPQLLTVPDGWTIMMSTPPVTPAHPWTVKYIPEAQERKMYAKRVITDNARLSPQQIAAAVKALGGPASTRVRRELYCEHIVESTAVVIPEFDDANIIRDDEYQMPPFADAYTAMDPGIIHATGILGAYYDFKADKLIVDWDYAKPGQNSRALSRVIRAREHQFWGVPYEKPKSLTQPAWEAEEALIRGEYLPDIRPPSSPLTSQRNGRLMPAPFMRFSDTDSRLIGDLSTEHGIVFNAASKDDLEAAINSLRLRIAERRILFKARAVNAINHTRNGQWNKQRTKFAEQPGGGHYDCLAALVYLNREIPWGRNPNPPQFFDKRTHFVPGAPVQSTPTIRALNAIFRRGKR